MATATKTKTYVFYMDPGHGWLAVKRTELDRLGIADKITSCSYQRGGTVYLEEDRDMETFIAAKRNAGDMFSFDNRHTDKNHQIRGYDPYAN